MLHLAAAALALALSTSLDEHDPDPAVLGRWAGGYGDREADRWQSLIVDVELDEAGQLTLLLPGRPTEDSAQRSRIRVEGPRVRVEFSLSGERIRLEGTLEDGVLRGRSKESGHEGTFVLRHERPDDDARTASCAGVYRVDGEAGFQIRKSLHLLFTDLERGDRRVLYALGNDRYAAGPAFTLPVPQTLEVRFERGPDGAVRGLTVHEEGREPRRARRIPLGPVEEFSFESAAAAGEPVRIAGELTFPAGEGPHPAVVWVHGSGPTDRGGAGRWPMFLASRGFAVLAMDKRGVGASGGSYTLPDGGRDNLPHMRRRAGDVRAALTALATDPRIDVERIGLVGGSQAGWVIPMAAAEGGAAFTVILSGGATALSYEGVFSQAAEEDGAGRDAPSIEVALARTRRHRASDPDFDAYFAALESPGLWLYGDKDRSNPTALCVELLERIAAEHERDFTIVRFPDGNHSLGVCRYGGAAELCARDRAVPGLFSSIDAWLAEKGFLERE